MSDSDTENGRVIPPLEALSLPRRVFPIHTFLEYAAALAVFAVSSALGLWIQRWTGHQAIALIYLLAVVGLALFLRRGPILFGTALTALGWSYLFAPPQYSFRIADFYDQMMFAMYFMVALTMGELTRLVRTLRERDAHSRLVAESERLSRALLNSVSHELRTPLAAITAASNTLCASNSLTPVQQQLASEMESAAARLNRVVQGLLSAARLQSGQVRPKLQWCDISDVVNVALRNTAEFRKGHPVQNSVRRDLALVKADFVLLEQAVANLLINAAAHTPEGTPVEIRAAVVDQALCLEVADRGLGIPGDQLEAIFDLFRRLPGAHTGGTGLGLGIVKGFVEAQHGTVTATNRPGGGASFTIRLPEITTPQMPEERADHSR